nr:hypothetical protein Iba_chr04dCG15030 [Ipomoea batatas]
MLEVVARTCSLMWEEEQWALDWMGTRSIFVATRPNEINKVYEEKLEGQFDRKGKGRGIDEEFTNPKEQERVDKSMIEKAKAIYGVQSAFRDMCLALERVVQVKCPRTPNKQRREPTLDDSFDSSSSNDLGDGHNNNQGVSNHPQDEEELRMIVVKDIHPVDHHHVSMEVDYQADHHIISSPREDDEPRDDGDMYALPFAVIVPTICSSSTRDENLEASRDVSHKDSNPRTEVLEPQSEHTEEIGIGVSPSSARDDNLEAFRGASHEDLNSNPVEKFVQVDQSIEVSPRVSPSLARDGNVEAPSSVSHEDSNPSEDLGDVPMFDVEFQADPSIARVLSRNVEFEKRMTKAQSENEESFASLRETLSNMDLINENMAVSGTNVRENQWSIKELQLLTNHLSDQLNEAMKDNANNGEKRLQKSRPRPK